MYENKAGWVNLCIQLLYTAIKDGESIEDDLILTNARTFVEKETGLTVNIMKQHITEVFEAPLNEEEIALDAKNMTIRELGQKYHLSPSSMHYYLKKHNIKMERKTIDYDNLSKILKDCNGKFTITQMANMTGKGFYAVKHCCEEYNIPFKGRAC